MKKQPRIIVIKLANCKDKRMILRHVHKFKGSCIFINEDFSKQTKTVLHINIRSIQKNFEKFQELSKTLKFNFSAVCLSEIWCESFFNKKLKL